jgi:glucosamine-6-phosphate deaminase
MTPYPMTKKDVFCFLNQTSNTMSTIQPIRQLWVDSLHVKIFGSREDMGQAAAEDAIEELYRLSGQTEMIRMIFAAAPSQNEFLKYFTNRKEFTWNRIEAFHMDEYIGLPEDSPQRFGRFLKDKLFDKLPFAKVHYLMPEPENPSLAVNEYEIKIREKAADIIALGIGENTHLAFNDPPVADFDDPAMVKIIELDHDCRQQQVHDGCFATIEAVPQSAVTLTIPALFMGRKLICVVPGSRKSRAVYNTLTSEVSEKCPASILRKHPNATLYLDPDAARLIS